MWSHWYEQDSLVQLWTGTSYVWVGHWIIRWNCKHMDVSLCMYRKIWLHVCRVEQAQRDVYGIRVLLFESEKILAFEFCIFSKHLLEFWLPFPSEIVKGGNKDWNQAYVRFMPHEVALQTHDVSLSACGPSNAMLWARGRGATINLGDVSSQCNLETNEAKWCILLQKKCNGIHRLMAML